MTRVNVLGGGPAGLYAALLLKKTHPAWEISVWERNPRDVTWGWGVVFSDRTLAGLREADHPSYQAITDAFVLWEAIDIHVHDRLLRCDGHAFAGLARKRLLAILQARCEELGVRLAFGTEVDDPARLRDADLLIAADGVNSRTRALYGEAFEPRVTLGRSKYIWFGTDKVFDAFTFVFRDTEYGLFQVHAYPFDGQLGTFIVETREETWRAAGLEDADEAASLAFCQQLFADHLGRHRLLSNRSLWLTFPTLHCRRWSHENVVLLGDAVHTAHFSIGSGTKLALEDAIALANAFETSDDVRAALRGYEQARRPRVEATQRAAAESQRYFETVERYRDADPEGFAFHLLTRSGRITWDTLRTRDARFVASVDRWFQQQHVPGPAPLLAPPPALTPLRLRELTLANRLVVQPATGHVARDGMPDDRLLADARRIAAAGAGLVLIPDVAIAPEARITPHDTGCWDDAQRGAWADLAGAIHRETAAQIGLALLHAGRRGATRPRARGIDRPLRDGGWPLVAPSALAWSRWSATPRAMTRDDMDAIREAYVAATLRAAGAGIDLLLLDMSRGYLLASFLSPLTNLRDDEDGGDAERRLRFPLEVLDAVRASWPAERPLAVALSASDRARGGNRLADSVAIARLLRAHGCDLLAVHAGQTVASEQPDDGNDALAAAGDVLRNEAGIPVLLSAALTRSDQLNTLLAAGRADLGVWWGETAGEAAGEDPHPPAPSPNTGRGGAASYGRCSDSADRPHRPSPPLPVLGEGAGG